MKVLVADDDPDFRSMIREAAPPWLDVLTCASSADAIDLMHSAEAADLDLALVDLRMDPHLAETAELEGLALVRWMRGDHPAVPVVLVSGSAVPSAWGGPAREAGTLGFLSKPLDLEHFFALLDAYRRLFGPAGG